jgi:hypothetical protein
MHNPTLSHPFYHLPAHPYFGLVHGARFNDLFLFAIIIIAAWTIAMAMTASKSK